MVRAGGNGACVEVADLRAVIVVRDAKDPDGPRLVFPAADWRAFTDAVKAERFGLS